MTVEERRRFVDKVGISEKRHAPPGVTSGDLCAAAADQLLSELNIDRSLIDALVLVTQTRDHIYPCTSVILQHKLGLPSTCLAFDVPLGCSGYIYGLAILGSLMESGTIKKGLLLSGDNCSYTASYKDKTFFPLLGDAGTATLLEYDESATPVFITLYSDGSGYDQLIMPGGGFREPWDERVITETVCFDGIARKGYQAYIDGLKIFAFSMREVAGNIRETLKLSGSEQEMVDYYVLHQANFLINESIRKQLKIPKEKCPNSMNHFGNTGAASVPLTIVSELQGVITNRKMLLAGFGVGLSWGSALLHIEKCAVLKLTEYD
jgi:3-oxoacyl-[acyl-carrier-protein] synthase-3